MIKNLHNNPLSNWKHLRTSLTMLEDTVKQIRALFAGCVSQQEVKSIVAELRPSHNKKAASASCICSGPVDKYHLLTSTPWLVIVLYMPEVTILQKTGHNGVIIIDGDGLLTDPLGKASHTEKALHPVSTTYRSKTNIQKRTKQWTKEVNARLLLACALLTYHKFETLEFNPEPATQLQLGRMLGWDQYKVSRVMATIFGKHPMTKYRKLCRSQGSIRGFLEKLDDGTSRPDGIVDLK